MWETVELREVRVFLAIAEELHFGRAAERLGITQSRASQSLRELELKLGQRLVHRTSRRVALTAAGERLRAALEPAYEDLAAALRQARGEDEEIAGGLRIGLPGAVPQSPALIEAIVAFEQRYPACKVEVMELPLSEGLDPLRRGDVDVLVSRMPIEQSDLVTGPSLPPELRLLAMAVGHPLADRTEVSTEDIADFEVADTTGLVPPELEGVLIPTRSASGRPMKRRRLQHHDWSELVAMIARGRIVHPAFVGQFAHPSIATVPITDLPPWESGLAWRRDSRDPRLHIFAQVAEEVLQTQSRVVTR